MGEQTARRIGLRCAACRKMGLAVEVGTVPARLWARCTHCGEVETVYVEAAPHGLSIRRREPVVPVSEEEGEGG